MNSSWSKDFERSLTEVEKKALLDDLNSINIKTLQPFFVLLAFYFVVGVTGNSLALYLYLQTSLRASLSSTFYVTMTVYSLLTSGVCVPLEAYNSLWKNINHDNQPLCQMYRFFNNTVFVASIFILSCIAVDCYLRICHPLYFVSQTKIQIVCFMTGVISILIHIPVTILAFGFTEVETGQPGVFGFLCSFKETKTAISVITFYNHFLGVLFVFTLFLLIASYGLVFQKWRHVKTKRLESTTSFQETKACTTSSTQIISLDASACGSSPSSRQRSASGTFTSDAKPVAFSVPVCPPDSSASGSTAPPSQANIKPDQKPIGIKQDSVNSVHEQLKTNEELRQVTARSVRNSIDAKSLSETGSNGNSKAKETAEHTNVSPDLKARSKRSINTPLKLTSFPSTVPSQQGNCQNKADIETNMDCPEFKSTPAQSPTTYVNTKEGPGHLTARSLSSSIDANSLSETHSNGSGKAKETAEHTKISPDSKARSTVPRQKENVQYKEINNKVLSKESTSKNVTKSRLVKIIGGIKKMNFNFISVLRHKTAHRYSDGQDKPKIKQDNSKQRLSGSKQNRSTATSLSSIGSVDEDFQLMRSTRSGEDDRQIIARQSGTTKGHGPDESHQTSLVLHDVTRRNSSSLQNRRLVADTDLHGTATSVGVTGGIQMPLFDLEPFVVNSYTSSPSPSGKSSPPSTPVSNADPLEPTSLSDTGLKAERDGSPQATSGSITSEREPSVSSDTLVADGVNVGSKRSSVEDAHDDSACKSPDGRLASKQVKVLFKKSSWDRPLIERGENVSATHANALSFMVVSIIFCISYGLTAVVLEVNPFIKHWKVSIAREFVFKLTYLQNTCSPFIYWHFNVRFRTEAQRVVKRLKSYFTERLERIISV